MSHDFVMNYFLRAAILYAIKFTTLKMLPTNLRLNSITPRIYYEFFKDAILQNLAPTLIDAGA